VRIDVCIATFKRPSLLAKLLHSLALQERPADVDLHVVVVDNDSDGSAREVATAASAELPLVYAIEPMRGVASARSRCLALVEGEFFAFIDDDEEAAPTWLRALVDAQVQYDADVVFGPVLPILASGGPSWVLRGQFFERPRHATGHPVSTGASNNTLVRTSFVRSHGIDFDLTLATIGEDTDFFARLGDAGARMIWCDLAVVHEIVPIERQATRWLVSRAYQAGKVLPSIFPASGYLPRRILWLLRRTTIALGTGIATPLLWLFGQELGVRALQKSASNVGQLVGFRAAIERQQRTR
jgi:succinoglycan biosynthesis protein ExoM